VRRSKITPANNRIDVVQVSFAGVTVSAECDGFEFTFRGHQDAAMVEQIVVDPLVGPALQVEEADMALQLLTVPERGCQRHHQVFLLWHQTQRVVRINRRKAGVFQGMRGAVERQGTLGKIDFFQ